jgi:hypothetical protein
VTKASEPWMPPLAQYLSLMNWNPHYGDYVTWSGWLNTWHGYVVGHDPETGELEIIWAGLPFILVTMTPQEQKAETQKLELAKIHSARPGTFAVLQHDQTHNSNCWYV